MITVNHALVLNKVVYMKAQKIMNGGFKDRVTP